MSKHKILAQAVLIALSISYLVPIANASDDKESIILSYKEQAIAGDAFAFGQLLKLAGLGDALAQYSVGTMFFTGDDGIPRNYEEAFAWFSQAAEQDYPPAQYQMGVMYATGKGVEQDNAKAYYWYKKVEGIIEPAREAILKMAIESK